jgi:acyl carrier protein
VAQASVEGRMTVATIEASIEAFVEETFLTTRENTGLEPNTDLVATGVLDSINVLQLVEFLEEGYDILLEPEDLPRLTSVENIARVVREKASA